MLQPGIEPRTVRLPALKCTIKSKRKEGSPGIEPKDAFLDHHSGLLAARVPGGRARSTSAYLNPVIASIPDHPVYQRRKRPPAPPVLVHIRKGTRLQISQIASLAATLFHGQQRRRAQPVRPIAARHRRRARRGGRRAPRGDRRGAAFPHPSSGRFPRVHA